ncbi:MAG: hypothetical protein AAF705_22765 [Bacteroidota bacterium]
MKILFTTLLITFSVHYCSEAQLQQSIVVEKLFAELWLSLEKEGDSQKAAALAKDIDIQLVPLREQWQIPLNKEQTEKRRVRLIAAEKAFATLQNSLNKDQLPAAKIYLDHTIQQLKLADQPTLEILYLGQAADFITNWLETRKIVNDQMLCLMEWQEYVWWANLVKSNWQDLENCDPDLSVYPWSGEKMAEFQEAKLQLGLEINRFSLDIVRGDQCSSQEYATAVDAALYQFISQFGLGASQTAWAN